MGKATRRGGARSKKPLRPPPPEHPWDRQPDETPPAYEAFRTYLELGPDRTLEEVARKLAKSIPLIKRWSARNTWVARTDAFDAEVYKRADEATLDKASGDVAERAKRHADIARIHQEALALPAKELLERLQANPQLLRRLDLDELLKVQAAAARALPRAVAVERLVTGQSTSNSGGHDGGPLPASPTAAERAEAEQIAASMTDDALTAFLAGAAAERQRREEEEAKR